MAEPDEKSLVKLVEGLVAEREAMAAREKKLIDDLNAALAKMGYRVVPAKAAGGAETGKKRGRPPGSGKKEEPPKAAAAS